MNMMNKYIRNNPLNGIEIDYKKVNKDFNTMMKKCKAPNGLFDPTHIPFNDCKWSVLMSERSSSKTTQLLLYSMVIWKLYGIKACYIKKTKEQITKSMYTLLFKVIVDPYFNYIRYITDGKFNNIHVDTTKYCYFVNYDENGKITDKASDPFMILMSVDQYDRYMSSFNVPDFDTIIFDEFSWGTYQQDEFIHLCQLIETIRRDRESTRITLLSNTITPYNQYLRELGISSYLAKMHKSDYAVITSQLGAKVYCELLNVDMHNTVEFNSKALSYFGFENPALRSLYGGEWEIKGFRHLPPSEHRDITKTNILLMYMGKYMRVEGFRDEKQIGIHLTNFTKEVTSKYIIVTDQPEYNTKNIMIAHHPIIHRLRNYDSLGLLYFADNEIGLMWNALKENIK